MDAPISSEPPLLRQQTFDVVCIKKDKSSLSVLPEDIKRHQVTATDAQEARFKASKEVEKDDLIVLHAVPPGFITELERQARIRASASSLPAYDRSKY